MLRDKWVCVVNLCALSLALGLGVMKTEAAETKPAVPTGTEANPAEASSGPPLKVNSDPHTWLQLGILPSKSRLRPGEDLELTFEADRTCRALLALVGRGEKITILWPNKDSAWNDEVRANAPITIPAPGSPVKLRFDGAKPVERIVAAAWTGDGDLIDPAQLDAKAGGVFKEFTPGTTAFFQQLASRMQAAELAGHWGTSEITVPIDALTSRACPDATKIQVVVELSEPGEGRGGLTPKTVGALESAGFSMDESYAPVTLESGHASLTRKGGPGGGDTPSKLIRGAVQQSRIANLESQPGVLKVWMDYELKKWRPPCPVQSCDCDSETAKGRISDVAKALGVDRIWAAGFRGAGIVVGICDDGVRAPGRYSGPKRTISNVAGGFPEHEWGLRSEEHGMMCATDALGMAPEAGIYDFPGRHWSQHIPQYDWAIRRHQLDGTPQIISNSWGPGPKDLALLFNPNHPFTRKVREAVEEGIVVLFAAGNCGQTCPSDDCGANTGPGRSIQGPNGLRVVITVGAANMYGQWIGYSSQGPANFFLRKPDLCGVSHFSGYKPVDTGTSASCPMVAGICALLKQAAPHLSPRGIKRILTTTAADIGLPGWDVHSGAGFIQPLKAFEQLSVARTGGSLMSRPAAPSSPTPRLMQK